MTVSLNGGELTDAIELAVLVGTIVSMLVIGLIFYFIVRPPRHARQAPPPVEIDEETAEEMLRLMDRMERRLEVLERVVGADERQRPALAEPELEENSTPFVAATPRRRLRRDNEIQGRKA